MQATQVELDVAPTELEKVPGGQSVHAATEVPDDELVYVPAGHGMGSGDPGGQNAPATLHDAHIDEETAPDELEKVPAGHFEHTLRPNVAA